ncbi:sickle tail protein homolog isoform X4 [Brienomyrus brachyistius]|uniref:sickle tail protein homolog isoform X4 n=1 Tax=Brienomyrus brachyistius TaxID=42636 RepID=UPI0020B445F0|nr:sickle tail protein homolog isoform X4 [Brienomyrus brachyistius]
MTGKLEALPRNKQRVPAFLRCSRHFAESSLPREQPKGSLRSASPDDAELLGHKATPASGSNRPDPKSSRSAPRRHTVGGARSSQEILAMQPSDMDRKREAFLEHLKQKYPHHAIAIMGHQERLREQALQCMLSSLHSELDIQRYLLRIETSQKSRSPKHSPPQPAAAELGEHFPAGSLDLLETMSDMDGPCAFTRGIRSRASLPVVRSTNQTKDRSLAACTHLSFPVTDDRSRSPLGVLYLQYGDDTRAMRMPNEITSGDTIRALFVSAFPQQLTMKMLDSPSMAIYMKDDMRNVYYELSDVRNITDHACLKVYHKDPAHAFSHSPRPANGDARMVYAPRDGQHSLRQPPSPHVMQGPLSPPSPQSMPPSPSRIPYGPRSGILPGGATLPRERLANVSPGRAASPCPSAILERRDVKPDDDVGLKGATLARGDSLYGDPYLLHEGRLSIASSHSSHPADLVDHVAMPPYHRRPVPSPYEDPALYRQKSRKFVDPQLPSLACKTPPPSPHRGEASLQLERASPIRQSFRKDSVDSLSKARGNMTSPDLLPLQGHGTSPSPKDPQTRERMKAMEQQIASLTGLVQHALMKTPGVQGANELSGDWPPGASSPVQNVNCGEAVSPLGSFPCTAVSPVHGVQLESTPTPPPTPLDHASIQLSLTHFRCNVTDLRLQLDQMRQMQLQNQETLQLMLKDAEQEIGHKVAEALQRLEDPVQKQRALVEEERHKYLGMEEKVLTQLGDLEGYVEGLQKDGAVTLKDVEDGAVGLQKVSEALAALRGEFPALQAKMRAVLRVEVEAVRFLKEEPHKLDSMLKRVKILTTMLGGLQRNGTVEDQEVPEPRMELETEPLEADIPELARAPPTLRPEGQGSAIRSEFMSPAPLIIHQTLSSPVQGQQAQQSTAPMCQASPPSTPVGPPTRERPTPILEPPATDSRALFIEEIHTRREKSQQRAMSIEAAERDWEEKRQNMTHYDGKDFEKVLQEAQANMMKGFPSMELTSQDEASPAPSADQPNEVDAQEVVCPPSGVPPPEGVREPRTEKPAKQNQTGKPLKPPTEPKPTLDKLSQAVTDKVGKLGAEKKSPPPPPPRKTYTLGSGMTTGRSGEVIFTARKESVTAQDEDEEATSPQRSKPKVKSPTESKPKPLSPPPVTASGVRDEEDDDNRIMAELQVFQKCTFKDVEAKCFVEHARVETQVREIRPGAMVSPRDRKQKSGGRPDDREADENGSGLVRQGPGVIYYVTGQITKEQPADATEERKEGRSSGAGPSQVAHVNAFDVSPRQQEGGADEPPAPRCPLEDGPASPPMVITATTESPDGGHGREDSGSHELPLGGGTMETLRGSGRNEATPSTFPVERSIGPEVVGSNISVNWVMHSTAPAVIPPTILVDKVVSYTSPEVVPSTISVERVVPSIGPEVIPSTIMVDRSLPSTGPEVVSPNIPVDRAVPSRVPEVVAPPIVVERAVSSTGADIAPRTSGSREFTEEDFSDATLSPDLPGDEGPPPPDNIAFMITDSKVQALSCREYQKIVSTRAGQVQTVKVDSDQEVTSQEDGFDAKPVIIIFDEPMDIRSAYKRLSTIFECEEELERMLSEETIDEENEDEPKMDSGGQQVKLGNDAVGRTADGVDGQRGRGTLQPGARECITPGRGEGERGEGKQETKKKFRFKFPKKRLAALSQAIRTGTKTGKKTLQVVVYEEEEEADGTIKQHKEAKCIEIGHSKDPPEPPPKCRTDDIRKSTYRTLDSLEQTIKQLETTISEMGPRSSEEPADSLTRVGDPLAREEEAPSPHPVKPVPKARKSLTRKKNKPALLPRPGTATVPTSQQSANPASSTSRMPVPISAKPRQPAGGAEKTGKQANLQDPHRQFRQANGTAKKAGGDIKTSPPTLPASKIPAFCPSSGKISSQPTSNSDTTNPLSPTTSPSQPSPKSSIPSPHSSRPTPCNIPSLSNGSLKPTSPAHSGKSHPTSFSTQTQNSRPSPSSPLSPTSLSHSGKSIRTIHTPSFTSHKPLNGKYAVPPASAASKDAS